MTRAEAVLGVLGAARGDAERRTREQPLGSNSGPRVNQMLATVGLDPGEPWCAAAVATWGVEALGKEWPLPLTGDCDVLLDFARRKGILFFTPEPGDVFLVRATPDDATHTGLVKALNPGGATFQTYEGNSNAAGGREGIEVVERPARRIAEKGSRPSVVFVRWPLLYQAVAGRSIPVYLGTQHVLDARIRNGVAFVPVRAFLKAFFSQSEVEEHLAYDADDNMLTWYGNPLPGNPQVLDGVAWLPVRPLANLLVLVAEYDPDTPVIRIHR